MSQVVLPCEENATLDELMLAMEGAPNRRSFVRITVVRSLLMGVDRQTLCSMFGRSDRMIRMWVALYNRGGVDALLTKPRSGRPRRVAFQQLEDFLVPILEEPSKAGEVHWTGVKVHGYLVQELEVELSYRTTIRWLHELSFHLRVPQTWPEKQKPEDREAFRQELERLCEDPEVELWFCDECGVEGDPKPKRRWPQPGETRRVPYLGKHIRQNVIGSVAPQTGELFSLIVDGVDSEVFQFYVDEMAKAVPKKNGKRQLLILDNASWHRSKKIEWRHFEPKFLPAYSPDYNPIERLWLRLKADWFTDYLCESNKALADRLCQALMSFVDDKDKTASICSIRK